MFGIGTGEILLILVIAMLVVGPERMVEFSRTMGHMIAQFRRTTDEATKEFKEAFAVDEMKSLTQELKQEIASPVTTPATAIPTVTAGTPGMSAPGSPAHTEATPPQGIPTEPIETVTLKEALAGELVDGEIEVEEAPVQPVTAEVSLEPAAEVTEGISIEMASLMPEDPDVEPTIIETLEMAPEEAAPSPAVTEG
jgi:sec-independent protein translocase protein TatB